ncbi:MAG: hypothetical protein ACJAV1_002988 [Paraglaciecola sp.]|jgi:hypothetical protein
MNTSFSFNTIVIALSAIILTGCGDAETTINELPPIVVDAHDDHDDHDDHDAHDDHDDNMGRIAVTSSESNMLSMFDLDDNSQLDTFSLLHDDNRLLASGGHRYAVVTSRANDYVGFIDGGLWQEDHVSHPHNYTQAPVMINYELSGVRPTHFYSYKGQMAIFNDGDAESNLPASAVVLSDTDIAAESSNLATLNLPLNMHGAAIPRGEYLLASIRRDDVESTSVNPVLPDQVGVFHLHDGEYEQEQVLDVLCPNLHGAAQNEEFVAFACSDGLLITHEHDNAFEAEKLLNIDALGSSRIGSLYGHENSDVIFGVASDSDAGTAWLLAVDPTTMQMEEVDWQPVEGASATAYSFSYDGEYFLILDNQGFVTILEPHEHDGENHWEFHDRVDFTEQDVSTMPEGASFSMTVAQNGELVYVSDPIAQHIVKINLETVTVTHEIELDFIPASIAWLGIAEMSNH